MWSLDPALADYFSEMCEVKFYNVCASREILYIPVHKESLQSRVFENSKLMFWYYITILAFTAIAELMKIIIWDL